jgi:hypothetical protein
MTAALTGWSGTIVRLRATPGYGLAPTPYGGVERRRMLGYSYTYYPFCPGGKYCASDDPPPYIPPPPIPDFPQQPPQPPPQQN